jgi:peptidoglycan/LPS O-acetylase OafA/YrhL
LPEPNLCTDPGIGFWHLHGGPKQEAGTNNETMIADAAHVAPPKFTVLQQLRGISIALVLFWHVLLKAGLHYRFFGDPISIDTFFIVGGFIMFYSSHRDFGHPGAVGAYYFRRFARLIPLYWICVFAYVLGVTIATDQPAIQPSAILGTLFFVPYDYHFESDTLSAVYLVGWFLDYLVLFDFVFGFFYFFRAAGAPSLFQRRWCCSY